MTTPAQQQDKVQNAQINTQAIAPVTLTPNQGSVVPNVWQQNYVQDSIGDNPTITPPSEENIHKNMFIGSGMVGLMAALATGNPAAGLVAGMWGAVAIHDHGYDLRQRSKQVNKLQADGYSFPAILDWYKTGDNKELDKEHTQMEQDRRADNRTVNETSRFNAQQANEASRFNAQQANSESRFERAQVAAEARAKMAQKSGDKVAEHNLMTQHREMLNTMLGDSKKEIERRQAENDAYHQGIQSLALGNNMGDESAFMAYMRAEAPNASPKLTQAHFIGNATASGVMDKMNQVLQRKMSWGQLTDADRQNLKIAFNTIHEANEAAYQENIAPIAAGAQGQDPQTLAEVAGVLHITPMQLQRLGEKYLSGASNAQSFDDAYQQKSDPNEVEYK